MIGELNKWLGRFFGGKQPVAHDPGLIAEVARLAAAGRMDRREWSRPLRELTYVVFDTETTGFHPYAGDELLSIGAVSIRAGVPDETNVFHQWIRPLKPIPETVVHLTGVTEDDLRDAPDALEAIRRFLQFAQQHVLVAHNAEFDLHFLNRPIRQFCKQTLAHTTIDTLALANHLHPLKQPHSLDDLLVHYGVPVYGRHHALSDARMTAQLFVRMLDHLEECGIKTMTGLHHFLKMSRAVRQYSL